MQGTYIPVDGLITHSLEASELSYWRRARRANHTPRSARADFESSRSSIKLPSVYPTAACNQSTKLYELSFHSALGDCSPVGIRVNYSGAACSCASCGAAWTLAAFGELGACVDNVVSRKHNGTNITTTTTLVCKADRAGDGGKSKFDWVLLLVIVGIALALVALLVGVSVTRRRHAARESARYGALLPSQDEQPTSYGSTPQAAQPR